MRDFFARKRCEANGQASVNPPSPGSAADATLGTAPVPARPLGVLESNLRRNLQRLRHEPPHERSIEQRIADLELQVALLMHAAVPPNCVVCGTPLEVEDAHYLRDTDEPLVCPEHRNDAA